MKKPFNKIPFCLFFLFIITPVLFVGCGQKTSTETSNDITSSEATPKEAVSTEVAPSEVSANQKPTPQVSDNNIDISSSTSVSGNALLPEATPQLPEATPQLPEYTVTKLETETTLYASISLNVRSGPTTDFPVVGSLAKAQAIQVTGQADTGWYEILYQGTQAYASHLYLQEQPPVDPTPSILPTQPPAQQPTDQAAAPTPAQPPAKPSAPPVVAPAGIILVGDSRFVQMREAVGDAGCTWISESSRGYTWFEEKAIARIDNNAGKGSKIVINLGVNDPEHYNSYMEKVNAKAAEWVGKGATVYYLSVNPVWENPYCTKEEITTFNEKMSAGLTNVIWLDSYTHLEGIGYKLVDGLHFSSETYTNIFNYIISNI